MISIIEKRLGFRFGTYIFANPKNNYTCDQAHFVSYDDVKSDFFQVKRRTPIFRLDQSLEAIFRQFNKTTRNEINRTLSDETLTFDLDSTQYEAFYQLYTEFERRKNRLRYLPRLQILKPKSKLFMASYQTKPVAAVLCFDDDRVLRARIICSRRLEDGDAEAKKMSSFATRRLVYEICRYGIERGYRTFDLGEICEDKNNPSYNISQFKLSFGGDLIENFHYYKIYHPMLRALARLRHVKYF